MPSPQLHIGRTQMYSLAGNTKEFIGKKECFPTYYDFLALALSDNISL